MPPASVAVLVSSPGLATAGTAGFAAGAGAGAGAGADTASGSNCSTNHLRAFPGEGADRRGEIDRGAGRDAKFQIHGHGWRSTPSA